jgi:hypothetical protein
MKFRVLLLLALSLTSCAAALPRPQLMPCAPVIRQAHRIADQILDTVPEIPLHDPKAAENFCFERLRAMGYTWTVKDPGAVNENSGATFAGHVRLPANWYQRGPWGRAMLICHEMVHAHDEALFGVGQAALMYMRPPGRLGIELAAYTVSRRLFWAATNRKSERERFFRERVASLKAKYIEPALRRYWSER